MYFFPPSTGHVARRWIVAVHWHIGRVALAVRNRRRGREPRVARRRHRRSAHQVVGRSIAEAQVPRERRGNASVHQAPRRAALGWTREHERLAYIHPPPLQRRGPPSLLLKLGGLRWKKVHLRRMSRHRGALRRHRHAAHGVSGAWLHLWRAHQRTRRQGRRELVRSACVPCTAEGRLEPKSLAKEALVQIRRGALVVLLALAHWCLRRAGRRQRGGRCQGTAERVLRRMALTVPGASQPRLLSSELETFAKALRLLWSAARTYLDQLRCATRVRFWRRYVDCGHRRRLYHSVLWLCGMRRGHVELWYKEPRKARAWWNG